MIGFGGRNVALSKRPYTFLPTYVPTFLATYLPAFLPTYVPTFLPTYLPTYLPSKVHEDFKVVPLLQNFYVNTSNNG